MVVVQMLRQTMDRRSVPWPCPIQAPPRTDERPAVSRNHLRARDTARMFQGFWVTPVRAIYGPRDLCHRSERRLLIDGSGDVWFDLRGHLDALSAWGGD